MDNFYSKSNNCPSKMSDPRAPYDTNIGFVDNFVLNSTYMEKLQVKSPYEYRQKLQTDGLKMLENEIQFLNTNQSCPVTNGKCNN